MEMYNLWDYLFGEDTFSVNEKDYLNPEEKIRNLTRERTGLRRCREAVFLDMINPKNDVKKEFGRVVAKLLKECSFEDMTPITRFIEPEILEQISFREPTRHEKAIAECTTKSTNSVTVVIDGLKHNYVGVTDKKLRSKWDMYCGRKYRWASDFVYQIDLIRLFSELIALSECKRYYDERLKELSLTERLENVVFAQSARWGSSPVSVKEDEEAYIDFLRGLGMSYKISTGTCYMEAYRYLNGNPIIVQGTNSVAWSVLKNIVDEYGVEKQRDKYLKENRSDYATSFVDKKNIPQKYLDAANESAFRKKFGYVEFDVDCDLDKLAELEKEFSALMALFKVDLTDYVLRFRKLGHHRAIGLYYPFFNCLCVDIRAPHSYVHEFFHLLDFKNGELSLKSSFYNLRCAYADCIKRTHNEMEDGELKKVLSGKSKYNIDYYLEPTEIFARCGEIYAYEYMGIRNSLGKNTGFEEFAYNVSDEVKAEIKKYFDIALVGIIKEGGLNVESV